MKVIIIQPPLVQLNTPYPSGAYLSAFFKKLASENGVRGSAEGGSSCGSGSLSGASSLCESNRSRGPEIESVKWYDFSERVFNALFCRRGLETLFSLSQEKALSLAETAENQGDEETAWNLRRYVSQSDMWIDWIDTIVSILRGNDRELSHEFVRSAHVPRGRRMETFLESLDHEVGIDDAQLLASFALADLADYINYVFDNNFSLIRYAEAVSTGNSTFAQIEKTLDAPFLRTFYASLLEEMLREIAGEGSGASAGVLSSVASGNGEPGSATCAASFLFCISVPFGGTFSAALLTCRMIKARFGEKAIVCLGGGYINTALREIRDPRIFEYADYISYDKGYGFYSGLLQGTLSEAVENDAEKRAALVGTGLCFRRGGWTVLTPSEKDRQLEEMMTRNLCPDFSDIDFSRYPKVSDDTNAMHRIWTDGSWIKAFLAYGCYWHRCAFCDTMLDYVCKYNPVSTTTLYKGIYEQAERAGVYGIHFVDEAAPPVLLEQFALENCRNETGAKRKLSFWGNIRFEKAFTRDLSDILAHGGMTGVSGGIEIASGEGLSDVNKGIDIDGLVGACAAFKEAGILVHAYMIYGFYNETPQMLIDSAETLRQLFAAGLIDSAFWHKFTLTKYSTVYNNWKTGKCKDIKPLPPKEDSFAVYELRFEGEQKSEKYGASLMTALDAWMHGRGFEKPVQKWFPFYMPKPSVATDFIDKAIARYEHRRDAAFNEKPPADGRQNAGRSAADNASGGNSQNASGRHSLESDFSKYVWIGGKPIVVRRGKATFIEWTYMGEMFSVQVPAKGATNANRATKATNLSNATNKTSATGAKTAEIAVKSLACNGETVIPEWLFRAVRGKGLAKRI